MKCEKCSHILADGAKFCPECGTPVPKPEPTEPVSKEEFGDILELEEVAKLFKISRCQVFELMNNDGLPFFPVGIKKKRFLKDELLAWAKNRQTSCRQPPRSIRAI